VKPSGRLQAALTGWPRSDGPLPKNAARFWSRAPRASSGYLIRRFNDQLNPVTRAGD